MVEYLSKITESHSKEDRLVELERPLYKLYLTKIFAESFDPKEKEGSEEVPQVVMWRRKR